MRTRKTYGRKRIILDYSEVTPENFKEVLQKALPIYGQNKADCEYLIDYYLGKQDILDRPPPTTSTINNTTVVNYTQPITRDSVGYTFGNGIELVQRDINKIDDVRTLAEIYNYENDSFVDICSGIYGSICGFSYQITLPSPNIEQDYTPSVPIVYSYLDPRYTFVVQSNDVGNPQIMSCMISISNDGTKMFTCYTPKYKFTCKGLDFSNLKIEPNVVGLDPITMIENSIFLMGDWECIVSLLNAINQTTSDSLNDIEGTIRSILVILGAEFDENEDVEEANLAKIKKNRLLTLANATGGNLDAKFIAPQLDSTSVENLREYLQEAKNIITGIPDRSSNSSGGDTGQAVLNRDGWTNLEIVARLKEMFFKKGKKRQLEVGIQILKMLDIVSKDLNVFDFDIVIGRHNTDNLQTKTQAFATLVATHELATIDCLEIACLTNKAREVVERGKKAKEERQKDEIKQEKALTDVYTSTEEKTVINETA